jgi:hypothetical protein
MQRPIVRFSYDIDARGRYGYHSRVEYQYISDKQLKKERQGIEALGCLIESGIDWLLDRQGFRRWIKRVIRWTMHKCLLITSR